MLVKIHYELPDGSSDSLILEGTLEEIRIQAHKEVVCRNAKNPWSEVLNEEGSGQ